MAQAIVTGGSGYVGGHLIRLLLDEDHFDTIINLDYKEPPSRLRGEDQYHFIKVDVREPIEPALFKKLGCGDETVIFNLAAICKIPGYPTIDYFRTNIKGAETVCQLAEDLGVGTIVFTSTISTYGASENLKNEQSIPQPDDAYGSSKLAAEYIHRGWQQKNHSKRNLVILRPGIIFGKNEQANFTRLYGALKKGFFVYPGRRDTRKACVYVKDAARACIHFSRQGKGIQLYNLVYLQPPTIETICQALVKNTDAGPARFTVPGFLLKGAARVIDTLGRILGKNFQGIHPDRVQKVMISTNISGQKLQESSFSLQYSLGEGLQEWFKECEGSLY